MVQWHATSKGFIQTDETGRPTGKVHPHSYHEASGHVMRITHHDDGSTSANIASPRTIVSYLPDTGEIVGVIRGVIVGVELDGINSVQVERKDGKTTINIEIPEGLPADFNMAQKNYKIDTRSGYILQSDSVI